MSAAPDAARVAAAGLALAVGVAALWGTRSMSTLGSVFPTTAAAVMILAALGVLLRALLGARRAGAEARAGGEGALAPPRAPGSTPRFIGAAVAIVLWALAFKPLGFVASGALGLLAFGVLSWREPMSAKALALHLAAGAAILLGFYVLMVEVLRLAVP